MSTQTAKPSPLRHLRTAGRILLGALFVMTGANGFLNFLPAPAEAMPETAMTLMGAFMTSGYMMPLIFGTQLLGGLLLLSGIFAPLGLVVLAPVVVNIVLFHAYAAPQGMGMAIGVCILTIALAISYRNVFAPLFVKPK